mmetsp:Transcript_36303/g.41359  ORF Transcript_36303/g.41359 Transcript_36303/m.41359 type:complete len:221 (+) Transcript_36303:234-896(+)
MIVACSSRPFFQINLNSLFFANFFPSRTISVVNWVTGSQIQVMPIVIFSRNIVIFTGSGDQRIILGELIKKKRESRKQKCKSCNKDNETKHNSLIITSATSSRVTFVKDWVGKSLSFSFFRRSFLVGFSVFTFFSSFRFAPAVLYSWRWKNHQYFPLLHIEEKHNSDRSIGRGERSMWDSFYVIRRKEDDPRGKFLLPRRGSRKRSLGMEIGHINPCLQN